MNRNVGTYPRGIQRGGGAKAPTRNPWTSCSPDRESGVLNTVLNNEEASYRVKLVNGEAVEQFAEELLYRRRFDHGSLDLLLSMMVASRPQPHRGLWKNAKQSSFALTFGFYVHGPMSGITKAPASIPRCVAM